MAEETQAYYLNPDLELDSHFDLDKLREDAIARIQKYSGNVWTDHNVHDAGIAILEQLCFAIADISYQFAQLADFDSLDSIVGKSPYFQQSPDYQSTRINLKDFNRAILEHPAIYKVFFIPSISYPTVSGLFDVVVFSEPEANRSDIDYFLDQLRNSWRPITNSIKAFHFPPDRKVEIQLKVEIQKNENIQQVLNDYHEEMKEFLRGKNQNENLTQHRIISIDDFAEKVRFEIQSADLVAQLNSVESTKHIKEISIQDSEYNFVWTLTYPKPYRLSLHPNSSITLFSNGVEIAHWTAESQIQQTIKSTTKTEKGRFNNTTQTNEVVYSTLQSGFPESFGLEKGFNEPLEPEDSSALQIKGILTTFDLIISRFIAQLEKSYALLNNQNANLTQIAQKIVSAIPGIEYIWIDFNQKYQNQYTLDKSNSNYQRYQNWKVYLEDLKNNLHELVSNTHRVEAEYLENQSQTYRFLLSLLGADLTNFDLLNTKLSYENEALRLKSMLDFWLHNRLTRIHSKKHNPNCLTREVTEGYAGLIAQHLGLDFDTESFVGGISTITRLLTDKSKRKFQLQVPFEELIQWGRNPDAYVINDEQRTTEIRNHSFKLIGNFEDILDDHEVSQSIEKLNQINDLAEGFLLIEHFEFAPDIEEACFGAFVKHNTTYLFDIEAKFKLRELYAILRSFEQALVNQQFNLEVKKIGHKQYVNFFKATGIYQKINGYFNSEFEALQAQQTQLSKFTLSEIQYQFFDTQFFKHPDRIDPYSHQITLCFPNWNKAFWDLARKQKIQRFIDQITPPHIVCNIKWHSPFELNELMQTIKRYHESKSSKGLQPLRQRIFQILS